MLIDISWWILPLRKVGRQQVRHLVPAAQNQLGPLHRIAAIPFLLLLMPATRDNMTKRPMCLQHINVYV
jgi:hypothetical protein